MFHLHKIILMKQAPYTILLLLIVISLNACVPQKKYLAAQNRVARLHQDSVNFYNEILGLKGEKS